MRIKNTIFLGLLALPSLVYATNPTTGLIDNIGDWIGTLIPITVSLALLFFFWGMVMFIRNSGDSTAREEGKQKMIWGIVALFVMMSVWGLVAFLGNTLGIGNPTNNSVPPPSVDRSI